MTVFTLDISFTEEALQSLYTTKSGVAIASPLNGKDITIIWQSISPFQFNRVQFEAAYGMYASTSAISNNATIVSTSTVPPPAVIAKTYTLEPSGAISGPHSGGTPDAYTLQNKFAPEDIMTMGLSQNAIVNDQERNGNYISADKVMLNSSLTMIPKNNLSLWIHPLDEENNTITGSISSPVTEIMFNGNTTKISVEYDRLTGQFIIK